MTDHPADLRRLTAAQLEKLGQDSLREHLLAQAVVPHHNYAPVTAGTLDTLLHDPACSTSAPSSASDPTSSRSPWPK